MSAESLRRRALRVAAQAANITGYVGRKRRASHNGWCYVPWRYLDGLADSLRELGVDPCADNLGREVFERMRAKRDGQS